MEKMKEAVQSQQTDLNIAYVSSETMLDLLHPTLNLAFPLAGFSGTEDHTILEEYGTNG